MFENRDLFFVKETDTQGHKLDDLVFMKKYAKKQCDIINAENAHNVYFYPNGLQLNTDKVDIAKTPSYNCIYTISDLNYQDHLIKAEMF
jgi:hypothetical protein